MRLRNTSKSGDVDEFKSQSKKCRKGVNKMKHNHGNKRMNDEVMVKVKSSQVDERVKMTFKTAKKRETWKVVNKMKPNYENQRQKRVNDEVMAKVKSSQVDEREKMTVKTAMKKRETWNSNCGTDIGVFEQICDNVGNKQNPNNIMPSKTHVSTRKNIRTETSLGDQIFNEKGPAGIADNSTNIEKDNQVAEAQMMDEDKDTQIILEKLVKTPATMDIKQETDDEEEIQIIYENLVPTPAILNIKQEKPFYHPKLSFTLVNENLEAASQVIDQSVPKNGQIHIRKDMFEMTSIEKLPAGTSKSPAKPKQHLGPSESFVTSEQPSEFKSPVNCQHPEGSRRHNTASSLPFTHSGLIMTPDGSSASNSSSTGLITTPNGSSASNSSYSGLIMTPDGSSASNSSSPGLIMTPGGSAASNSSSTGLIMTPVGSSASNSSSPVGSSASNSSSTGLIMTPVGSSASHSSSRGLIITPVGSSAGNSSSTGSLGETTGRIHKEATRSHVNSPIIVSGGITGHIHDGNSSLLPSQRQSKYHPGPSKSLVKSKQPPGISETSEVPVNCEHPEGITPVGSSASDSFPTGSSGETTWRIEGRVITSQGNSAATNEGEEVPGPLHDGAIPSIGHKIESHENLTIKFDTGDVSVTDGGRTVQMKMTNGSISGQAEDVTNIVKTLSQFVRDL